MPGRRGEGHRGKGTQIAVDVVAATIEGLDGAKDSKRAGTCAEVRCSVRRQISTIPDAAGNHEYLAQIPAS